MLRVLRPSRWTHPRLRPPADVEIGSSSAAPSADVGNISIISLFWRADPLVKAVFVLLVAASLWSWTIIISKWLMLASLRRKADEFEKTFWSGLSLDELFQQFSQRPDHPMATVFVSALREWRRAFETGAPRETLLPGIKDRIEKAMNVTILREMDGLERQLGFLATVGSVSPFIGLFGTVWGIMNSFSAIAARHDTTLAVVRTRHRRGLVRHRHGPARSHSGGDFLQPLRQRNGALQQSARTVLPTSSRPSCPASSMRRPRADGSNASKPRSMRRRRPMAEINVTPFVDVMLVLLIVFMVTAPLLTVGVPVDLPKTKAQTLGQDREPLSVSVRRNGSIYLQNTPIEEDALVARLKRFPRTATTSAFSCAATNPSIMGV